jgi:hypothetical protein
MDEINDFDKMVLLGLVEPAAIDPLTGEMLYTFSKDLEKTNPQLHQLIMDNFYMSALKLWELGFISMDVTHDNPLVNLTPKAFDEDQVNTLNEDMRFSLSEIKRGLLQ